MAMIALLVVATLSTIAVIFKRPAIETDLLQRTRQALTEANLPVDKISFRGRDGILQGAVSSKEQAARLQDVVQQVYGVRDVDNQLELEPPAKGAAETTFQTALEAAALEPPVAGSFVNGLFVPQKKYPVEKIDLSGIRFPYAKAELDADAEAALEPVIKELQAHPTYVVEISTHTDAEGTALGNMAVTQARAGAVKTYLLSKGIAAGRLHAQGYGSTRPIADNATEGGRLANRRLEITVLKE
jgi:outer membrane protein OmpA-like peptidoglycan-associated protein